MTHEQGNRIRAAISSLGDSDWFVGGTHEDRETAVVSDERLVRRTEKPSAAEDLLYPAAVECQRRAKSISS